ADGMATVREEPVPGRKGDVRGTQGQHGQVIRGHSVEEGVGGQSRRSDLDHGYHRQLVIQVAHAGLAVSLRPGTEDTLDRDQGRIVHQPVGCGQARGPREYSPVPGVPGCGGRAVAVARRERAPCEIDTVRTRRLITLWFAVS